MNKTIKENPDLKIVWKPELEFGIEYSIDVFHAEKPCEVCGESGAYVLRDDPNSGAACRNCINDDHKTILRIEELPEGHNE